MADSRRDQEHLGIDTNVLVAYLERSHPSHKQTEWLARRAVALNPMTVHEAYHTLVFKMKWRPKEASRVLTEASIDDQSLFSDQTLTTTRAGLHIAMEHKLGGRDALILANVLTAGIREFVTFDKTLVGLKRVRYRKAALTIKVP